jgi:hypothetical protein
MGSDCEAVKQKISIRYFGLKEMDRQHLPKKIMRELKYRSLCVLRAVDSHFNKAKINTAQPRASPLAATEQLDMDLNQFVYTNIYNCLSFHALNYRVYGNMENIRP